jgi:hypothetical protein
MFKQLIAILCFTAFITSCTKEAATFEQPTESLMQDFKTNFSVGNLQNESWVKAIGTVEANDAKVSDIKLDDGRTANYIMLPIKKSGGIVGIVYVIKSDNIFKSLIIDGSHFKNGKGEISYYESNSGLMLKEAVENYKIKSTSIDNSLQTRAASCWKTRYSAGKSACESDANCRAMCDFADMFGSQCSGSMMVAAVISCWF